MVKDIPFGSIPVAAGLTDHTGRAAVTRRQLVLSTRSASAGTESRSLARSSRAGAPMPTFL